MSLALVFILFLFLVSSVDTPVKPTILDLQYVTESVAVIHSNGICRRLGVSEVVLSQADQTYPLNTAGAPGKRFMYGLQDWYNGNGVLNGRAVPVTLSVLCKVLEESRCRSVAEGLRKQSTYTHTIECTYILNTKHVFTF